MGAASTSQRSRVGTFVHTACCLDLGTYVLVCMLAVSSVAATPTGSFAASAALVQADTVKQVARGLRPSQNVAPSAYTAQRGNVSIGHTQNWTTLQGPDGLLYAGNTEGVLVFDGVRWEAVPIAADPLSGRGRMASALALHHDTVFVGSRGTFGYLAPDARGQLQYVSLLDAVPEGERDFDRVWSITAGRTGVYLLTDRRLFRWADGNVTSWTPEDVDVANDLSSTKDDRSFFLSFAAQGTVYVHVRGVGLTRVDGDTLRLVPDGERFAGEGIYTVLPFDEERLLIGTRSMGLFLYDGHRARPFETEADAFLDAHQLYHGARLPDGTFALATRQRGVVILDRKGRVRRAIDESVGLRDNMVRHVQVDREGGMWLALNDGLARVEIGAPYERFDERLGLSGDLMTAVRHEGMLYVGTHAGLFRLRPTGHGAFDRHGRFDRIEGLGASCTDLVSTDAGLLAAVGRTVHVVRDTTARAVVDDMGATPLALHRSRRDPGRVYVALRDGLAALVLDDARWRYEEVAPTLEAPINFLTQDSSGAVWGAADAHGLYRVEAPATAPVVTRFDTTDGLPPLIDHRAFVLDGRLAVGTRRGLYRHDAQAGRFVPDSTLDAAVAGGTDAFVTHIVESSAGTVWLRVAERPPDGDKPIVRFAETTGGYAPTDTLHRLRSSVVRTLLVEDEREGVWAGAVGEQGPLVRYRASDMRPVLPSVSATVRGARTLNRDSLLFGGVPMPGWTPPTLSYGGARALRFAYAVPQYSASDALRYQVWLDGFEESWSDWTTETQRDYTNLTEGTYTFRVRARDVHGRLSREGTFLFTIAPPWYRTWWAYGLYGLLGLGVVAGAVQWRSARLRARARRLEAEVEARTAEVARQKEQLEEQNTRLEAQADRLTQLDEAKSRFFANLSHEFRTPITLILGPIEDLLASTSEDEEHTETLRLVHRSANRLLRLINQLLDLARLEAGHMRLEAVRIDAASFLRSVTRAFEPLAERRGLDLTFAVSKTAEEPAPLYADRDKLEKIMANLLSNAVKATPAGGRIDVRLRRRGPRATIAVEDTGRGIPPDELSTIFDRFEQHDDASVEPGTGIGLNLVKEFAELHGGTVEAESTPGEGTQFTVRLPLGREHLHEDQIVESPRRNEDEDTPVAGSVARPADGPGDEEAEAPSDEDDVPTLLVVDDNPDIRAYVREQMEGRFRVAEAADGIEGLSRAEALLPDCIIADVMMPRLDGYALTEALKADPDLDHVPLILLTAKADDAHRIEGLETGADDYLTKPFNAQELVARVDNLIASRHRLREKFSRTVMKPSEVDVEAADAAFLRTVREAVEAHLTDADFSVGQLADAVALSPSQLQRKVKALTDRTPVQLIRVIRLERAAQLLDQDAGTITEIAYAVGFNSYSHFARSFKEYFGQSASAYRDG